MERKEVVNLFYLIFKNKNALNIVTQRAYGLTLNEVGKKVNLTRERVRQIENNSYISFLDFVNNVKLFSTIKESEYIDIKKIEDYDSNMGLITFYFMKEHPYNIVDGSFYSNFLNSIIYGKPFLEVQFENQIKISDEVIEEHIIEKLISIYGKKIVSANIENIDIYMRRIGFNKYNGVFKRRRYSINDAIEEISENYFQNGINPNDDEELEILKNILKEKYSMSSKSSYSLRARVQDALVCCGPSLFCSKNLIEDNEDVFIQINQYLNKKLKDVDKIYYKEIYDDLNLDNVFKNKDALHGFITKYKERFNNIGYRRDYVYIKD